MNKLPPKLARTHLRCLIEALTNVREKIQEAKGLGSEVNPDLVKRRKLLKRVRESMKACNACDKETMATFTLEGPLPTLRESELKMQTAILR